eukprot:NODE_491_length_7770_cov_0.866771.p6 type:complete len:125 gc:universal NODE_491_length_7770_cov_0.866771:2094-1720(-)
MDRVLEIWVYDVAGFAVCTVAERRIAAVVTASIAHYAVAQTIFVNICKVKIRIALAIANKIVESEDRSEPYWAHIGDIKWSKCHTVQTTAPDGDILIPKFRDCQTKKNKHGLYCSYLQQSQKGS